MIRALITYALLSSLAGCVPMPIQQEAGARGKIIDIDTQKPIKNARICIDQVKARCISSDVEGKFDLEPIYKDRWQFFMIEPLIMLHGRFTVEAEGYAEQTILADHSNLIRVELTHSK